MLAKISKKIKALLRWMFGAPVSDLPPVFGDTVPSDLRAFEEEMEHIQDEEHPVKQYSTKKQPLTNPPKKDVPLERL